VTFATPERETITYKSPPPKKASVTDEEWTEYFRNTPIKAPPVSPAKQKAVSSVPVKTVAAITGVAALSNIPGANGQLVTADVFTTPALFSSYALLFEFGVTCFVLGMLMGAMLASSGPKAIAARSLASRHLYNLMR
jgi:hypothetical protein